jgi:predicted nucleic acid-binding protein
VTAVADSSPLVILTKLGCLDCLNRVFPRVYISNEVHYEVVVAGAGLPGASEVSKAEWIEVKSIQNPAGLLSAQQKYSLGPGEMSTIVLAKELGASPVLLDDYRARKLAKAEGDMFVVGADFCDLKTGDFEMIREYMLEYKTKKQSWQQ